MPSTDLLENPQSELASELYSVDGVLLGHPQPGALMEVGKKRATLNEPEN